MSLLLLVLAALCELVAALSGFDWLISAEHVLGWVALGLFFFILAGLAGPALALRRSE